MDDELVRQAIDGNSDALATLYHRHLDAIYRYVYRRVGTQADAEDLTSQTFLRMVENLRQYRGPGKFRNWLLGIAGHVINDFWRTQYRSENPLDELEVKWVADSFARDDPSSDAERQKKLELFIKEQLARLPDHYRRVLELRFLEGRSVRETAQEMNCSENVVKVRQHRALKELAQAMIAAEDDEFSELMAIGANEDESRREIRTSKSIH